MKHMGTLWEGIRYGRVDGIVCFCDLLKVCSEDRIIVRVRIGEGSVEDSEVKEDGVLVMASRSSGKFFNGGLHNI